MRVYKRNNNFYSVVNREGREVAVFNYYKSAIRFVKQQRGGR